MESERQLIYLQGLFAVSMYLGCFICYILPIKLMDRYAKSSATSQDNNLHLLGDHHSHHHDNNHHSHQDKSLWAGEFVANCNSAGAGIFLAICFLGLMPIVNSEFEKYFQIAGVTLPVTYPVAEFTTLIGFFLVLLLEQLVMMCQSKRSLSSSPVLNLDEDEDHDQTGEQRQSLLQDGDLDNVLAFEEISFHDQDGDQESRLHSGLQSHSCRSQSGRSKCKIPKIQEHSHSHSHLINPGDKSGLAFFVLMFATSVHSVFEGLALGLLDDVNKAIHIFIGIILHECLVAAALGLNSIKLNPLDPGIRFGAMFSATVPVGIILGVIIGYTPGKLGRLISAIFQGLAAGTFLHVSFCELIPVELSNESNAHFLGLRKFRLFRILLIFCGFILMSTLTAIISD